MMLRCPYCQVDPSWHYASRVTARENRNEPNQNKWVQWFLFQPLCPHAKAFGKTLVAVSKPDVPAIEARWDAHAEELLATYTESKAWDAHRREQWSKAHPNEPLPAIAEGWTEPQRVAFRERLWPKPKPLRDYTPPLALVHHDNRDEDEEPAF